MRAFALFNILFFVNSVLAALVPKELKKPASIDGTWEVTERYLDGVRDDSTSPIRWTIGGESLVIEMQRRGVFRRVAGFSYRLVKPQGGRANEIDYTLTPDNIESMTSTFRAVVELDGDTIKLCMSKSPEQDRPTKCEAMSGADLYVFKRVKEVKDK